jgi:hypothetical protein
MGYRNAPDEPGRPSGSARRVHPRFGARVREERGQSLVVIVISMTLIVAVAALAIDASDWFATHHKAQVTADAAALAAANYMGHGGSTGSATSTATTYASDNGLPISSNNVTVDASSKTVTVTVPTTGSLFFAGISLGSGPSISARAVASWKIRDCSSPASNCAFAFGADNVCGSTTGVQGIGGTKATPNSPTAVSNGVTVNKSGVGNSPAVTGEVVSASNITTYTNGNQNWPNANALYPSSEGTSSCSGPSPSNPSPYAGAVTDPVSSTFPIDYRTTYTACTTTCVSNFPPYCTVDSTAATLPITTPTVNAVYCDAGSGASVNTEDPSTWNGTINVSLQNNATFIAGTVNMTKSGNTTAGPAAGNQLLAYGAECNPSLAPPICSGGATTTSPAVTLSGGGGGTITGDSFAPSGVIDDYTSGSAQLQGFLEGWDVVYDANGTVLGEGPPVNNGTFVGDYLIQ